MPTTPADLVSQVLDEQDQPDIPTSVPLTDEQQAEARELEEEKNRLFEFNESKIYLKRIIDDWSEEIKRTQKNRDTRDVDLNVEDLRQRGELDEDETYIPVRVIDTNIQRELPAYVNYLKNSRRICTFRSFDKSSTNTQNLEIEFTQGSTYLEWETSHFKVLDGSETHGWDSCEVVYDESKPLHFAVEHIGHDMLYFPRSNKNIQQSPKVIRAYDLTIIQLKSFVASFGFEKAQVDTIIKNIKATQKETETVRVYKCLYKFEGVVYYAWFELQYSTADWLKKPEKLYLGIGTPESPTDIVQYPIFILPYRETEKPKLTDKRGRVYLDENKQEAQSAILSGYVNGLTRASNIYGAPEIEDGTGSSLKALENVKLISGRVMNKPMQFWSLPYPDPILLKSLEYFDSANSQETNQVNFAALNREDSRKTAKEISSAEQNQALLNSVQLTLFSTYIRAVYSFAWLIVQSQALQKKISFLMIEKQEPVLNPMTGQPMNDPQTGQPMTKSVWVNDVETIQQKYDIRAAGDVDVIQRQEKIAQMKQDWPVISQTALKDTFLAELIRLEYPDNGEKWAMILEQNGQMQQMQNLIMRLGTILSGAVEQSPDIMSSLSPSDQSSVQQTLQEAQQFIPATKPQTGIPQQPAAQQ